MRTYRLAALAAGTLTALAGLTLSLRAPYSASAAPAPAEARPGAGQLTIVNGKGEATALCPLKHTAVKADVAGYVSRVTVAQEFGNPSKEPIEAVYTFPLPDDAAVDDMTMHVGDRIIKGEIKKRDEARRIYEAARDAGMTAALLDQERPNIFTQSVANIMPGEKISISISYVNLLKYDEGQYEFSFPMVVGPRFIPSGSASLGAPGNPAITPDANKITPPITPEGTRAGHDISLAVNIDAGLEIGDVNSVLHAVNVGRPGPNRAQVALQNQQTIPNKDFILRYKVADKDLKTGVLAHATGKGGYFTLILQPPASPNAAKITAKEMVFVIDQTGSQSGQPIAKAKELMRLALKNLNPGDTFQVMGFNTEVHPCFPQPVPNTLENVNRALAFIEPLEGRGGTDILKSVDYALKIPDDPERLRVICYLTDGFVGNDMQIVDFLEKNRGTTRMFPFGVGNSVNRFLIEGMARAGRGVADYAPLDDSSPKIAERFYKRIQNPLLVDVNVDWGGLPVADVYPKRIPDVFSAAPIILKGRYTQAADGEITVRGMLRGKPWSQTVKLSLPATTSGGEAIPTLWAREKIEDLQGQDWMSQQRGTPDAKIQEQIVNLALDYRLMTQHTSFVAVEQKVVNISGKSRRVEVPVEMPEGVSYEGIFGERPREDQAATPPGEAILGKSVKTKSDRLNRFYAAPGAPPTSLPRPASAFGIQGQRGGQAYGYGGAGGSSGGFGGLAAGGAMRGPAGPQGPAGLPVGARGRRLALADREAEFEQLGPDLAAASAALPPAITKAKPSEHARFLAKPTGEHAVARAEWLLNEMAAGTPLGLKVLAALKPQQRQELLAKIKLAPAMRGLAQKVRSEGSNGSLNKPGLPEVNKGRVAVVVLLNSLPKDGMQRLQASGFRHTTALVPNRALLGEVAVAQLERLIALGFVRQIDAPKFRS